MKEDYNFKVLFQVFHLFQIHTLCLFNFSCKFIINSLFFLTLKSCWKTQNQVLTLITIDWPVINIYFELEFSGRFSISFLITQVVSVCGIFVIKKRKENAMSLSRLVSKNSALFFPNNGQPVLVGLKHLKMSDQRKLRLKVGKNNYFTGCFFKSSSSSLSI